MSPRLPLILAGGAATTVIAVAALFAHRPNPGPTATVAALLAVYALGLVLGRLAFGGTTR